MRIPRLGSSCAAVLAALAMTASAHATLLINVDKSAQRMTVTVDGQQRYVWPVSTGAQGYDTPGGDYKPFRMEKDHFSKEFDDAPMPNSIFFTMEGHAIHGTFEGRNLGHAVSHGCVRISRANSTILWDLVKKEKMANTRVVLTGEIPGGAGVPVARRPSPNYQRAYTTDDLDNEQVSAAVSARQQRAAPGWGGYNNGQNYYYYRDAPPPPRPAPGPFPFGW
jgi:L,D-transpeptidase catalytic domain